MKTYDEFWKELSPSYHVSGGALKIPIVAKPLPLPIGSIQETLSELTTQIVTQGRIDLKERMIEEGDASLVPLISDDFTGVMRYDCFIRKDNSIAIVEVNSDYPDGLLLHDQTLSALMGMPKTAHEDLFINLFNKDETIAVAYPEGATFTDAYFLEHHTLRKHGFDSLYTPFEKLEERNGVLMADTTPVSVVRRCFETRRMSDATQRMYAQAKKTRFVNSWDLRTLGYKSLLERIDHPAILRTIVLSGENRDQFIGEKDRWVLKPTNLYEGKGVVLGIDQTRETWEQSIKEALGKRFVMQEYAEPLSITVPIYTNGSIEEKAVYADLCPHVFIQKGKVVGFGHTLMRCSQSKILNTAHGGALGYWV